MYHFFVSFNYVFLWYFYIQLVNYFTGELYIYQCTSEGTNFYELIKITDD